MNIFCFHWKSGSSNLLVERIYSIVALRTFVLASVSNELLSKRRVLIKTGSQRSTRHWLNYFTRYFPWSTPHDIFILLRHSLWTLLKGLLNHSPLDISRRVLQSILRAVIWSIYFTWYSTRVFLKHTPRNSPFPVSLFSV